MKDLSYKVLVRMSFTKRA